MNIKYDKIADAAYIRLSDEKITKTKRLSDVIVVDMDKKDNIVGIEILEFSANQKTLENLQRNVQNGVPVSMVAGTPVTA